MITANEARDVMRRVPLTVEAFDMLDKIENMIVMAARTYKHDVFVECKSEKTALVLSGVLAGNGFAVSRDGGWLSISW